MHYRQQWYYHPHAHGLRKGDEHTAYTPVEYDTLYLLLCMILVFVCLMHNLN